MKQESVAILDIRSGEVLFALGAKGVNGTYFFNDVHTEEYEGFVAEGFLDESSFTLAVKKCINAVRQSYDGDLEEIYVGVPAPFVEVKTKGHTLSFPSKRKINEQDVEALYDSALNDLMAKGQLIHRSAMYFTLGDNRKYFSQKELYGTPSTLIKGALCYYFINEGLHRTLKKLLEKEEFEKITFIPSTLAQATYLIPEKRRDGYAFLLDIGFLTTSISVVYGKGIVREEVFNCGVGTIQVALMQSLGIDYALACEILSDANISSGVVERDLFWSKETLDRKFSIQRINDVIKYNLDFACERVESFFDKYYKGNAAELLESPMCITGEGVSAIRGVGEHVSRRLNRLTEVVYPDLPYYDKPMFSSRISLLNAATADGKKKGLLQRLFGGR